MTRWVLSAGTVLLLLGPPVLSAASRRDSPIVAEIEARHELLIAAFLWLDATLAGDFDTQSVFYPETMEAFYLWRNVPKSAVMAEKRRVFEKAETIKMKMEQPPQIVVDAPAKSARMYFRKKYLIKKGRSRDGEVLQELRWAKQSDGWKIVSERDLRVINPVRR